MSDWFRLFGNNGMLTTADTMGILEQQLRQLYGGFACPDPLVATAALNLCLLTAPIKISPQSSPNKEADKPTPFSIDDLLKTSVPSSSSSLSSTRSVETVDYSVEDLLNTDGRCRRSLERSNSRHVCGECGKSYATSSNLSRHKQTHRSLEGPDARRCPHCDRVYVSVAAFKMHILTHNAQHPCSLCNKQFSRPWLLKGHMRSHTGQKPFGCTYCGKAFADRSNLRAHMNTHDGIKKFRCELCGKWFSMKSYLNKHIEQVCIKRQAPAEEKIIVD